MMPALPREMIQACSATLIRNLDDVSSHIPPDSAAALWAVATKRPAPHVHGPGLVASRDAVPSPVIEAIVAGLRGNLPDVRLLKIETLASVRERLRALDPQER